MTQVAVRIPDDLVAEVDALIAQGRYATRAEAIRDGLVAVVRRERERQIDEALVKGYRRLPPTSVEHDWAAAASKEFIAEEPW